ncbi:transcription factor MAMYB-like [Tasmannia lanceolata]|uniref:transcription factor MAMYB-like n=1 Tax=Tasmannia lanceolata TaxID=3420 RepID=UPI0040636E9B
MEFLDEETRPRFLFQSRISSSSTSKQEIQKINKLQVALCSSISSFLSFSAIFYFQSQTLQFLLIWISLSLLLGSFAPISVTGGNICVGKGDLLEPPLPDLDPPEIEESKKRNPSRRPKTRRSENFTSISNHPIVELVNSEKTEKKVGDSVGNCNGNGSHVIGEEKEWNEEDFEILKKQIAKHPVGEPRRWELIADSFQGRHGLESVIKMAKSMAEKRPGGGDPFAQFLKQRKPLSKQLEVVNGETSVMENVEGKKESGGLNWSSGEDIALLNALKVFPKDVSMRWEKIAAAVPGKSKACCMKRVAELKRDFRSSKASEN